MTQSDVLARARRSVVPNHLKQKMKRGEIGFLYHTFLIPRHEIVGYTAQAGFDGLLIDLEHGTMGLEQACMLAAFALPTGVTPLIRTPTGSYEWVARALEFGAQGIIVPVVSTVEQARETVKNAKYPPFGTRQCGATLPTLSYDSYPYAITSEVLNDETLVVLIIETEKGLEAVEDIAKVPGVDVLMIGTPDLLADMGIPEELENPRFSAAIKRVCEAASAASVDGHDVFVGLGAFGGRPDLLEHYLTTYSNILFIPGAADGGQLQESMKKACEEFNTLGHKIKGTK